MSRAMAHGYWASSVPWHYTEMGRLDVASHRLKHHLNRYAVPEWVHQQVYLHPYPKELMLRNHV
jgi:uncharacterized protein YbgA (DUF1722 family)